MSLDDVEEQVDKTVGTWAPVRTAVVSACTWNWSLQLHVFVITGEWGFYLRISYTKQEEVLTFKEHPFHFLYNEKGDAHKRVWAQGLFQRKHFCSCIELLFFLFLDRVLSSPDYPQTHYPPATNRLPPSP